jgi:hypothetical protein
MATIDELRARGEDLFTGRTATPSVRADEPGRFSWFDAADGVAAVRLAARLSVLAAAAPTVEDGLEQALDLAEARTADDPTALVQQAMALFVTHDRAGRLLGKPRTLRARPELFRSSRDDDGVRASTPGPEPALDYWREDLFANEHHDHWHQVYPWPGIARFNGGVRAWAGSADRAGLAAVFEALSPGPDWQAFLDAAGPEEVSDAILPLLQAAAATADSWNAFLDALPPHGYRTVFRLNDRQGELFLYMHNQMLARYDAERLSNARPRVEAFGPDFTASIPDGYSPNLPPFTDREADEKLAQADVDALVQMQAPLDAAVAAQQLRRTVGSPVAVDGDSLGHAVEASHAALTGLSDTEYPGIHNRGHGMFGSIPGGQGFGVMNVPAVAIRDPVFWRWHKHIDTISTAWQETQPPYDFTDTPRVVIRDALSGAAANWTSPDVLLVSTAGLPAGADPAALVTAAMGGASFDTPVPTGPLTGADGLVVVDELTTRMQQSSLSDGRTVVHLTHDPFAVVVRVRNLENRPSAITLRIFLVPEQLADDRTAWMELDKHLVEVPTVGRSVVYRPDTEFAVVKKPAETDPQTVLDGANDPNDPSYCDCGWPYTLLLPRGTEDGMTFRLAVFCTDGARDLVGPSAECGSMSFCGAVDRYPDTRDMGYPFSRPFAASIPDTIRNLPAAAARTVTIRHVTG